MATRVLSPLNGRAVDFSEIPDPVFSGGFLGPGLGIDPDRDAQSAVAPVSGTIKSMMPHAFGIATADGLEVLVHLGIDTVQLNGEGFELHKAQGDAVEAGEVVISWTPSAVEAGGRSPMTPVIALQQEPESCTPLAQGAVRAGDPLFEIA